MLAELEVRMIHRLCDEAGVPRDRLAYTRVAYYIRFMENWLSFLEFLGCDVSIGESDEERRLVLSPVQAIADSDSDSATVDSGTDGN